MEHTKELILQAQKGDKRAVERLLEENMGLVYSIARKFVAAGQEQEDIVQIGAIGLIKCIERFDLQKEVKFSTYAVPMIIGEIKRFLRDDGMIKVSRTLKENQYRINRATAELAIILGREPLVGEVAKQVGLTVEDIMLSKEATLEIGSIYQTTTSQDSEMYVVDSICAQNVHVQENGSLEDEEKTDLINRMFLEKLLNQLSKLERRVIVLRYYENKTQSQIAKELGMSQVQVSRLEKKIILQMRKKADV